jgi:hypothetical protein
MTIPIIVCIICILTSAVKINADSDENISRNEVTLKTEYMIYANTNKSIQVLMTALNRSKTFKPSTIKDMEWLTGKWLVSERFIANHRNYFERYEAYDTLIIDKDSILQSKNYKTGWVVLADMTYRKSANSGRSLELEVNDGKVIVNHPPDVYYFRVPSFEETNWFIWEHSLSGDILVFRREKTEKEVKP